MNCLFSITCTWNFICTLSRTHLEPWDVGREENMSHFRDVLIFLVIGAGAGL